MADSDLPLRNDELAREETLETDSVAERIAKTGAESGPVSGPPGALAQPSPDRLTDVVLEEAMEDEVEEVACHGPHRPQQKGLAGAVKPPDPPMT
ncbi:unnamed protein product [Lota lota]